MPNAKTEQTASTQAQPKALKSIVVVGGGSAGWMTAAALSSLLSPKSVKITVIESDKIGTVGVGEATIPDIINFNAMLGINEAEFLKATNGTFKLGIEFSDWGKLGDRYLHPFGNHGVDMQGIDFHQYWLHSKTGGNTAPIESYSMCAAAAKQDKFMLPDNNPRSPLSHIRYAYHIDATLYARYLRSYAEKRGVERVEGIVKEVAQASGTGDITTLTLDDGRTIEGEFFFDATGFRALLTDKTLEVAFEDWSHWLPCDSAQAIASERQGPLLPYTKATARSAGWQWRIPTQHRTGNGHIYSSQYMDDGTAKNVLLENLDAPVIGEPKKIGFKTGRRKAFWTKNCIAVGLSAGFLEPLESTSLYLIQQGVSRFISLFPTADISDVVRAEYNRQMLKDFDQVRDFIILHYKATQRDDTPFWRYCSAMDIPDSLKQKMELFKEAGRVFRYDNELFTKPSWVAVSVGQNIIPKACDPIVASLPQSDVMNSLNSMQEAMQKTAQKMPSHADFIARYAASV